MANYILKYISRFQQGGGVQVFSPEPRTFMTPIEGMAPQALTYDLRINPINTGQLSKVVMDKKELALRREDLEFRKQAHEDDMRAKWFNQVADLYKQNKTVTGNVNGNGNFLNEFDRMEDSPYYQSLDANSKKLTDQKTEALATMIKGSPFDLKNFYEVKNLEQQIAEAAKTSPNRAAIRVDDMYNNNLFSIWTDEKSKVKLHKGAYMDHNNARLQHWQTGTGKYELRPDGQNAYTLGGKFDGIYNIDDDSKRLDEIYKSSRKIIEEPVTTLKDGIYSTDVQFAAPDAETSAGLAADAILNSPSVFYYYDDMIAGGSLYQTKDPVERKKKLKEMILAGYKAQDASIEAGNKLQGSKFMGIAPVTNKTVTMKYETSKVDKPGSGAPATPKDWLDNNGFSSGEIRLATSQAWQKWLSLGGKNDPYYMNKVMGAAAAAYQEGTVFGVDEDLIKTYEEEGTKAISKGIMAKLIQNPIIRDYNVQDLNAVSTFLANPGLQDAYYREYYYPNEVEPTFQKIRNGQIKLHPDLAGLNDNQLKYIIHHEGPTAGEYYLKNGKVKPGSSNTNSQAEINNSLPKLVGTENEDFITSLLKNNLEGAYDEVYIGNQPSSAVGAYGILFETHKQSIKDFMKKYPQLISQNVMVDGPLSTQQEDGQTGGGVGAATSKNNFILVGPNGREIINRTIAGTEGEKAVNIDDNFLKTYGAAVSVVVKTDPGTGVKSKWLKVKKGGYFTDEERNLGQQALIRLGLLDIDYIYPQPWSDVNISDLGKNRVKDLVIWENDKDKDHIYINIADAPKPKAKTGAAPKTNATKVESSPAPAAPDLSKNPYIIKQDSIFGTTPDTTGTNQ